jgi:hypothetical protein
LYGAHFLNRPFVFPLAIASLLAVALSACGSGGGSNSDPIGAVNGFEQALKNNDTQGAASWIAPAQRNTYLSDLTDNQSAGGALKTTVTNFQTTGVKVVDATHSIVSYSSDFQACPSQQTLLVSCQSLSQMAEHSDTDTGANSDGQVATVQVNGQWYVAYP